MGNTVFSEYLLISGLSQNLQLLEINEGYILIQRIEYI